MIPTHDYKSEFIRKYVHQGRAEAEAKAVLGVLESRGIEIPEQARERINGCADLDLLDGWIHRVAT